MNGRNHLGRHVRAPSALMRPNWESSKDRVIELWLEYAKFAPRLLRESILHEHGCIHLVGSKNEAMCDESFLGVAVLDISGFTQMTTDASRSGPIGSDSLHKLLNVFFAKLMEYLEKYGGDVFKFAGDGIIVVFLPTEEEKQSMNMEEQVCARAAQCVHNLIEEYGCVTITSSGNITSNVRDVEEQHVENKQDSVNSTPQEPVLSWGPQMQVDDTPDSTIESRIEDSLHQIWLVYGVNNWLSRPELSPEKGSWIFKDLQRKDKAKQKESRFREFWRKCEENLKIRMVNDKLWRTNVALKRTLLRKKSRGSLDPHALTHIWKEFRDPTDAHFHDHPPVSIKGMVSCGHVSFYRVSDKTSDMSNQVCELLMVDKIADSGPMHDVTVLDTVARKGETVISNRMLSYLKDMVSGVIISDGAMKIDSIQPLSPNIVDANPELILVKEKKILEHLSMSECIECLNMLKAHVPTAVTSLESEAYYNARDSTAKLATFSEDPNMMVSHRTCSIMFFKFMNLYKKHNTNSVQTVFETVLEHLQESGGDFLQMRTDEKGIILIAGHGLPRYYSTRRGNLGSLSVICSQKIISALADKGYRAFVGVTCGRVLFGSVGSDTRCEYTIYGDAINLAARLMMHASTSNQGYSLICDQETQAMCSISGQLRPVPIHDLHIKGFDSTVLAFTIEPCHDGDLSYQGLDAISIYSEGQTPFHEFVRCTNSIFIGREEEIATLTGLAEQIQHDDVGCLLCLQGIAATGKTHLLKEVFFRGKYPIIADGIERVYFSTKKEERETSRGFEVLLAKVYSTSSRGRSDDDTVKYAAEQFCKNFGISFSNEMAKYAECLIQDYIESQGNIEFNLSQDSTNLLSSSLMLLLHKYTGVYGPCVVILDGMELGNPCIWRFARLFQNSKIPRVLLILAYRWAQIVFDNVLKERDYQSQLSGAEPDLIDLFKKVGMSYYFGRMPLSSIRDRCMQDICTIVLDPGKNTMFLGQFSLENTKKFVTAIFPTLSVHDGVFRLLHDALGGHVLGIKFACIFLYLYHQKVWGEQKPSGFFLGIALIHQVRTFSPLWSASEARFDSLPMYFKSVAVCMSVIGNIVPEDILHQLCTGWRREAVVKCVSTLVYMGYILRKADTSGNTYYVWQHPILHLSILDMMAPGYRQETRARLALILEHYEFKKGLDFHSIGWLWRDSCRTAETLYWRRGLRAIAAYEDQACIDIESSNYSQAQECLRAAVVIAVGLVHKVEDVKNMRIIPQWRTAAWERCIAACECLKSDPDFLQASQHCMRALALLGEFRRPSSDTAHVKPTSKRLGINVSRSKRKTAKSLANLGNPLTITRYEGPDPHESIKEIEGFVTFFLPKKGRTHDEEREIERTTILETLLCIFESTGPWDVQSLDILFTACDAGLASATLNTTVHRLSTIQKRVRRLLKGKVRKSTDTGLRIKNLDSFDVEPLERFSSKA